MGIDKMTTPTRTIQVRKADSGFGWWAKTEMWTRYSDYLVDEEVWAPTRGLAISHIKNLKGRRERRYRRRTSWQDV